MNPTNDLVNYCLDLARRARDASRLLALAGSAQKDRWLQFAAEGLLARKQELLEANAQDVARAGEQQLTTAQIDRLRLTSSRIDAMADGLREVKMLPDPVGKDLDKQVRPNGLEIRKVSVPLGVLFFIYESRPNVTADAAALAIKSGNAIILRGGKEAIASNLAIFNVLREALTETGLPVDALQLVDKPDRQIVNQLLKLNEYIDLTIPRGGESLIRAVASRATMPVLKHYQGNCHVYVHGDADLDMAERIIVNAKCQRPGVCNAAESLLIHQTLAATFLPRIAAALRRQGVELRGCGRTCAHVPDVRPATEEDYAAEYLDLIISVKIVDDLTAAIVHINRYGSRHTDAIITRDSAAARRFVTEVDAAAVMVNASTRFHDGHEFGLGAEIGISTDKFHARGPCGLLELTTYKYVVFGDGQIRQ
jgi:glutamate-5-semialdehyde dehydrogenase